MTWEGRLREAAYTSPSGTRIPFEYQDITQEVQRRGSVFEFAGVDGGYVQQDGVGPRRFPLRCFFSGSEHDLAANTFEAALEEPGVGRLEHPIHGTADVVWLGDQKRLDPLVTGANQTVVELTFWETLIEIYPRASADRKIVAMTALEEHGRISGEQYANALNLGTATARQNVIATMRKKIGEIDKRLSKPTEAATEINRQFRDAQSAINSSLDVLIGNPVYLAQQVSNLIKAPATALIGIRDRILGYADLLRDILEDNAGNPFLSPLVRERVRISNDFHASDFTATNAVAGMAESAVNHTFLSKPEAIETAETIQVQFDAVVAWREAGFDTLAEIDPGASYQALQSAVASTVGYLVEISFTLVPERRIVLDRPRTIIDVCAEYYGSIDDKLDFLIDSNRLTGQEITLLPRGKELRIYA